jgi:hypothetical protein
MSRNCARLRATARVCPLCLADLAPRAERIKGAGRGVEAQRPAGANHDAAGSDRTSMMKLSDMKVLPPASADVPVG